MQTNSSNNRRKTPTPENNKRVMTIAAVAFTALAFFFLAFLFIGPKMHPATPTQMPDQSQPIVRNTPRPEPAPTPGLNLQIIENGPDVNAVQPDETQPENGVKQDSNSLTLTLDPDDKPANERNDEKVNDQPAKESEPVVQHPKPAAENTIKHTNTSKKEVFRVQAGAYANKANAENLASDLREKGYKVDIQPMQAENLTLYRVQIGAYKNKEDAQELASDLSKEGYSPSVILDK
ncbi:MAG: SPOR domain-containing protein [Armatimonadota bacterium]